MSEAKKAKNFCLTQNDMDRLGDTLNYLRSIHPNYLLVGREKAPTTGHIHGQIYVQFPVCRLPSIKKLAGAHIEKCKGSPEQNIAYCKKEGDIIVEEGTPRLCNSHSIKAVKEMPKEERNQLNINLYNIVSKINEKESNDITPNDIYKPDVQVYWLWGESGAGKTRYAMKQIGDRKFNMLKYENGFWHGIGEAKIALYDDFRDTHMKPTELINFIDYFKHPMNVKGGSELNNYMEIYITSIQNPEDIYKNTPEEYKKQWLRRIKEIIKFEVRSERSEQGEGQSSAARPREEHI